MDWLVGIGKIFLIIFAVANVAGLLYTNRGRLDYVWSIWRRFRPLMFFEVLVVLSLTFTIVLVLWWYVPFLRWGWLSFFTGGVGGNILLAPVMDLATADDASSANLVVWLVPLFFIALTVVLPFLAKEEEELFRKGKDGVREIVVSSIIFGLIHLIVGVPLCVGIALIGSGFFYAYKYKRAYDHFSRGGMGWYAAEEEAVLVSTAYHTLYNSVLMGFLITGIVVSILS